MRRMLSCSIWCWLVAIAVMSAGLSGCDSPSMRLAKKTREEALGRSVEQVKSLEVRRSERLQSTVKMLDDQTVSDSKKLDKSLKAVADMLPNEVRKWNSRQAAYQKAIQHQLEGRSESMERTVPHFIY